MRQQIFIDEENGKVTGVGPSVQGDPGDFLPANGKRTETPYPLEFCHPGSCSDQCDPDELRPAQ